MPILLAFWSLPLLQINVHGVIKKTQRRPSQPSPLRLPEVEQYVAVDRADVAFRATCYLANSRETRL